MADLFLLKNSQIIDLFEIKLDDFEGYFYFHGSKNLTRDVVFKGKTYLYIPCELSNLEYNSDGKQNRPTFTISNVNNFITNFIKDRSDLLNKRLYRKKIYSKDLDIENFGGSSKNLLGTQSFTEFINVDTFIFNKKNTENKEKVEFTLSNVLDIDGLTIPSRKVYSDFCSWQYRGDGCNYGKILNYNGPSIPVKTGYYSDLSEITGIDYSNLIVWLKPGDGQTFGIEAIRVDSVTKKSITGRKLINWENKAGDLNTSPSSPLPEMTLSTDTASYKAPLEYLNNGRCNDQVGIFFGSNHRDNNGSYLFIAENGSPAVPYDFNGPTNSTSLKYTIFCVYEHVDVLNGQAYKVLSSNLNLSGGGDWVMGSDRGFYDIAYLNNSRRWADSVSEASSIYNKLLSYSLTSSSANNETDFRRYGTVIKQGSAAGNHFGNLGLNYYWSQSSEFVFYELIIFKELLSNENIASVNTYLSNKYSLPFGPTSSLININKDSSEFFIGWEDGNIGVPISDENNKFFMKNMGTSPRPFEDYGLNDLTYRGDYNDSVQYKRGDFVKIDPAINFDFNENYIIKNFESPSRFFVCISENGSKNLNPLNFTNIWVEDKCSKTLNGCSARFNGGIPIPFGGFPGTITYEYKLPNS